MVERDSPHLIELLDLTYFSSRVIHVDLGSQFHADLLEVRAKLLCSRKGEASVAVQNYVDLLLALENGDYDLVLGTAECDDIEFKSGAYLLDQPRQKWELAKDVAALANSRGGIIVIGFRTLKSPNDIVDTVTEHRPILKALINWDSYRQIIGRWLRPVAAGLSGRWFPADPGVDRGVFVLIVPPQPESAKYFVLTEMLRDDGTFPGAVGIPIRRGDSVDWLGADSVHSLLREALWWRQRGPSLSEGPTAQPPGSQLNKEFQSVATKSRPQPVGRRCRFLPCTLCQGPIGTAQMISILVPASKGVSQNLQYCDRMVSTSELG